MNTNRYMYRVNGGLTPVVLGLLVANLVVFLLELVLPDWFVMLFGLTASGIRHGFVWQFITYMFLHSTGNFLHIIFNLMVLYMIGPETERGLGSKHFLLVYMLSGTLGGVMWVLLGYEAPCIGASGAMYGIVGAFAALWPRREITLLLFFVLPIRMRAWILACGLALIEFVFSLSTTLFAPGTGTVAHMVHLVGLVVSVAYVFILTHRNSRFSLRRPKWKVLDGGLRGTGQAYSPDDTAMGAIDPEVIDALLDKIANHGMHSLTARERAMLEAAGKRR